jgi:hypothetical protein
VPKDFGGVMHEWKKGDLHSGSKSGKVVKNQKQAEAIAFSEQRQMGKKDHLGKALSKVGKSGY